MSNSELILIVDDDDDMRDTIRALLELDGFQVLEAENATQMYQVVENNDVDLILLDLVMPGDDGLSIMREFRPNSNIPVIMLTGKGDVIDRIVGLEIGADDYITKPFHHRELTARIKTILRRRSQEVSDSDSSTKDQDKDASAKVTFNGWALDKYAHTLQNPDGNIVKITSHEFTILCALIDNAGRVLSRDQLLNYLDEGGREWSPYDRSLDVLIAKIRKKFDDKPKMPTFIRTIRQAGYVFVAEVEEIN